MSEILNNSLDLLGFELLINERMCKYDLILSLGNMFVSLIQANYFYRWLLLHFMTIPNLGCLQFCYYEQRSSQHFCAGL